MRQARGRAALRSRAKRSVSRKAALSLVHAQILISGAAPGRGATGHELVSGVGAELLPKKLLAFARTPEPVDDIAVLDRQSSKGAGDPHDAERETGHFANLDDDGVASLLPLDALP